MEEQKKRKRMVWLYQRRKQMGRIIKIRGKTKINSWELTAKRVEFKPSADFPHWCGFDKPQAARHKKPLQVPHVARGWGPWWWAVQTVSQQDLQENCGNKWRPPTWEKTEAIYSELAKESAIICIWKWLKSRQRLGNFTVEKKKKGRLQVCCDWRLLAWEHQRWVNGKRGILYGWLGSIFDFF